MSGRIISKAKSESSVECMKHTKVKHRIAEHPNNRVSPKRTQKIKARSCSRTAIMAQDLHKQEIWPRLRIEWMLLITFDYHEIFMNEYLHLKRNKDQKNKAMGF